MLGGSVPELRRTSNWAGVRISRHSSTDFSMRRFLGVEYSWLVMVVCGRKRRGVVVVVRGNRNPCIKVVVVPNDSRIKLMMVLPIFCFMIIIDFDDDGYKIVSYAFGH